MFGGARDNQNVVFYGGWVLPILLLLLVAINFATGKVYWPVKTRGYSIVAYHDAWRFWGSAALKLGLAVALHAWYKLANDQRTENLYIPLTIVAGAVMAIGLAAFVCGFVLDS